jgi:hypothetical protein
LPGWNIDSGFAYGKVSRERVEKYLALGDASFGHFDADCFFVAGAADLGFEDVALGHGGGSDDVNFDGDFAAFWAEGSFFVGCFGHGFNIILC